MTKKPYHKPELRELNQAEMSRGALAAASIALHMFTNGGCAGYEDQIMLFKIHARDFIQIRQLEDFVNQVLKESAMSG